MQPGKPDDARPTILQVIPELETGGAELSTLEIADAITMAGGRALVVSEGGRLEDRLKATGAELIYLKASSKNPLMLGYNARRIASLVKSRGVDLVHARSRAPAWSALWAARSTRRPFVTTYHGAYNEKSTLKSFYNSVMARGDVVIANSRYTADLIASRYSTPRDRMKVIYRGVPLGVFDPERVSNERIETLRRRWQVSSSDRVILHPARLTRWKGQVEVLEAAGQLAKQFPDLVFVLVGDAQGRDGYVEQLRGIIRRSGIEDRVRIAGHCDDMPAAYAASHVTIVASVEPEAFGRAAAEAQAMRCPVISTNIGAPPETVLVSERVGEGKDTGWLVPPSDAISLAQALREALNLDAEARAALGRRAREHIVSSFSTRRMQRETLAVYDALLGTRLVADFDRAAAR